MKANCNGRRRLSMRFAGWIFGLTVALVLSGGSAGAQTGDTAPSDKAIAASKQENHSPSVDTRPYQAFYLATSSQQNDANEVVIAIRNMLPPDVKVFLVSSQNA